MKDLIRALTILSKYCNDDYPTNCDHDVLRVTVNPDVVTEEDKLELSVLGFYGDNDLKCFYSYRFGSN